MEGLSYPAQIPPPAGAEEDHRHCNSKVGHSSWLVAAEGVAVAQTAPFMPEGRVVRTMEHQGNLSRQQMTLKVRKAERVEQRPRQQAGV